MFRRNLIPAWVAIIMVASMYLMGQGWSPTPPTGPPAPVPKTGQTTYYGVGDDGYWEKGVEWPIPRFVYNGNGTVTDNLTGLIWTQDADCDGLKEWYPALDYCNNLAESACGLADGSAPGDWRLANRSELESLLDMENIDPALPTGHPFTDVRWDDLYWTSTSYVVHVYDAAWAVGLYDGSVQDAYKDYDEAYVWCVRGGQ